MVEVGGKKVRGRQYPWGVVEVENPEHCDFVKLRSALGYHRYLNLSFIYLLMNGICPKFLPPSCSVADPGCLSRIRIFSIPDPNFSFPDSGSASKNLCILNQKFFTKLSEI
jgi:hypothetical protein